MVEPSLKPACELAQEIFCTKLAPHTCSQVGVDVEALAASLRKPLRPLWLSPASRVWLNHVPHLAELPFTPLFLVSASSPSRCRLTLGTILFLGQY